tara:strand:- start:298 stop:534 length:237 start_codon:yes stop_codon:yes gene_type:complete
MIKWLKRIMGYGSVPDVIENVMAPTPKKAAPKKATPKKKAPKVDLASMSKKDLLAHAKKTGVKANASMNKAALIKILK